MTLAGKTTFHFIQRHSKMHPLTRRPRFKNPLTFLAANPSVSSQLQTPPTSWVKGQCVACSLDARCPLPWIRIVSHKQYIVVNTVTIQHKTLVYQKCKCNLSAIVKQQEARNFVEMPPNKCLKSFAIVQPRPKECYREAHPSLPKTPSRTVRILSGNYYGWIKYMSEAGRSPPTSPSPRLYRSTSHETLLQVRSWSQSPLHPVLVSTGLLLTRHYYRSEAGRSPPLHPVLVSTGLLLTRRYYRSEAGRSPPLHPVLVSTGLLLTRRYYRSEAGCSPHFTQSSSLPVYFSRDITTGQKLVAVPTSPSPCLYRSTSHETLIQVRSWSQSPTSPSPRLYRSTFHETLLQVRSWSQSPTSPSPHLYPVYFSRDITTGQKLVAVPHFTQSSSLPVYFSRDVTTGQKLVAVPHFTQSSSLPVYFSRDVSTGQKLVAVPHFTQSSSLPVYFSRDITTGLNLLSGGSEASWSLGSPHNPRVLPSTTPSLLSMASPQLEVFVCHSISLIDNLPRITRLIPSGL